MLGKALFLCCVLGDLALSARAFSGSPSIFLGRQIPRLRGGGASCCQGSTNSAKAAPKMGLGVGDTLPKDLELFVREDGKTNTYTTEQLFSGKKSVIFGVPGAFTPTCSEQHLPSFVKHHEDLVKAGVGIVGCVSVNDAFVMREWGIAQNVGDKVKMLGDGAGKFTQAIGQLVDKGGNMGMRSQRFAMVVDEAMKIQMLALEKGGYGETSAESVLAFLNKQ